jgi:hypothetical protein
MIEIEIDKLTNSIENVVTGDSFATDILPVSISDLKITSKRNKWLFDWKYESKQPERSVYKLTIVNNPNVIQGMISIEIRSDHVYMHLLENAPFNLGRNKMYAGVAGNLVAFACKMSWDRGNEGFVVFQSKTQLIEHYEKMLGAVHEGGHTLIIYPHAALKLIQTYFQEQ